ncbi:hypothetical protein [Gordonia hydrophobica]|uniref:Uncharacterized protein n=1 Tax=Gordonia hydrophobica TaxID=40516 RepID=A0ABZ2U1R7_9ACTN|nr:hypothetical protein [Gordonia hydrophobica]MBM7367633.1 hypothetical protein [Gordonia hydrophobica]
MPAGLPTEQGLVWLFPRLLDRPLHPGHIRQHLLQSWNWAFGAAVHRAVITHCYPGVDSATAIHAIRDQLTSLLSLSAPDKNVAQIAALLDQHVDVFGPSDDAQFQAWRWGRLAEYQLGHALGPETWANSTTDLVRYTSRENMDMLDSADLASRVDTLLNVYYRRATRSSRSGADWTARSKPPPGMRAEPAMPRS